MGEVIGDAAVPCKTLGLVFDAGGTPQHVVAVLSIDARLSLDAAAAAVANALPPTAQKSNSSSGYPSTTDQPPLKKLRLAQRSELIPVFGHAAGALGPLGLRRNTEGIRPLVLMDAPL